MTWGVWNPSLTGRVKKWIEYFNALHPYGLPRTCCNIIILYNIIIFCSGNWVLYLSNHHAHVVLIYVTIRYTQIIWLTYTHSSTYYGYVQKIYRKKNHRKIMHFNSEQRARSLWLFIMIVHIRTCLWRFFFFPLSLSLSHSHAHTHIHFVCF